MSDLYFNQVVEEPKRASFYNNNGWFTVPRQWYAWTDENNQIWASPDGVQAERRYACKTNVDGYLVYQDLMRTALKL